MNNHPPETQPEHRTSIVASASEFTDGADSFDVDLPRAPATVNHGVDTTDDPSTASPETDILLSNQGQCINARLDNDVTSRNGDNQGLCNTNDILGQLVDDTGIERRKCPREIITD